MTDWCILRTAGPKTLPLVRSLAEAGFGAWSPVEVQAARVGTNRSRVERTVPVMPTYVLAPFVELSAILADRNNGGHPSFALLHYGERIPLIADRHVAHLRRIEEQAMRQHKAPMLSVGEQVSIPDGPFQGLGGTIVETAKGWVLVAFPRFPIPVRMQAWQVDPVKLQAAAHEPASKAA